MELRHCLPLNIPTTFLSSAKSQSQWKLVIGRSALIGSFRLFPLNST